MDERVLNQIDCDVLSSNNAERLSYVLQLFVIEARKMDGKKYPPGTVQVIADPTRSFEDIKQEKQLAVEDVKQKPIDIL